MIYVMNQILAGHEIFNTYGEYSNHKLLSDYGFCLEKNAFNAVALDREMVEDLISSVLGKRHCRRRMAFVREHADSMNLKEGEGDMQIGVFELTSGTLICRKLLLLLA